MKDPAHMTLGLQPDRDGRVLSIELLGWRVRLLTKRFICWAGFGDRLIEFCQDCGRKQPLVWWADDELWMDFVRQHGGTICPECFDRRATAKGIMLRWKPEPIP